MNFRKNNGSFCLEPLNCHAKAHTWKCNHLRTQLRIEVEAAKQRFGSMSLALRLPVLLRILVPTFSVGRTILDKQI